MTPDARTERLVANRRAAAAEKRTNALTIIDQMLSGSERVNFVEVHRAAGVSTWFVYNNPDVRHRIEAAMREQNDNKKTTTAQPLDDRTASGLRAELTDARIEIRDLRDERDRLRQRLQRDLGDQIDALGRKELLERLRVTEQDNTQLQTALRTTETELATTTRERDEAVALRYPIV